MLEIQTKQLPPDITVLGLTGRITIGPGLQGIGMGRREPGERETKKSYCRPDRSDAKKATSLLISESTLAGGTIGSDGGVGVAKGCPTLYNLGHENCETSKVACREIERGNRRAIHRGHHTTTRRVGDRQAVFASFEKATLRNRPNCSIAAPMLVGKFLINSVLSCRLLLIDQYGLRLMDEGQYSQGIVQDTIRRAVQKSACGKER